MNSLLGQAVHAQSSHRFMSATKVILSCL